MFYFLISRLVLILIVLLDVVVAELIAVLARRDDPQPVAERLLLEVSLRQVLEVALGEAHVGSHGQLLVLGVDADLLAQLARLAVDLDVLCEELLEVLDVLVVKDAVAGRLGVVDGEDALAVQNSVFLLSDAANHCEGYRMKKADIRINFDTNESECIEYFLSIIDL